jgi:hypothetical protein
MSKASDSILRGARQALAYVKGAREGFVAHVPREVDVAATRKSLALSQTDFAVLNSEQGRPLPLTPPARGGE